MTQEPATIFSIRVDPSPVRRVEHFRLTERLSGDDRNWTDTPSVGYHPFSDSTLLAGGRQLIMAQKGCCLYFKIIWTLIGVLGGIGIFVTFLTKYQNFHAASWGFVGGIFAGASLQLHLLYFKDRLEDWHNRATLTKIMYFGFAIFVLSTCACVTYIVLAVINKQDYELDNSHYYPAATFSFYSLKWALTLAWEARNYRFILSITNPILVPGMTSYST